MIDDVKDFIEDHKVLFVGGLAGLFVLFIVGGAVKSAIIARKAVQQPVQNTEVVAEAPAELQQAEVDNEPKSEYQQKLGIDADKGDGRVKVKEEKGAVDKTQNITQVEPNFKVTVSKFDHDSVPDKMVDGSSVKEYLAGVTLSNFESKWGTPLTAEDFHSTTRTLVGVRQDKMDFEKGDLQSVGWLIKNFGTLPKDSAVKFTNLHVVGDLATDHTALLCCYDWYSAFGINDTLVVFEDISDTVPVGTLQAGDEFSATVFVHNMQLKKVNEQNVVCVQYTPWNEDYSIYY